MTDRAVNLRYKISHSRRLPRLRVFWSNVLWVSEGRQIARDLVPMWMHIGMPRIREQLREEIKAEVQAGHLHSFWQYPDLLEPYDEHDGDAGGYGGF